jgi:multidrug resistance efflux pump
MKATPKVKDILITFAKEKKIYLEGNILKILKAEEGDTEFQKYLDVCKEKDISSRRKRLQVTKQVQAQNKELEAKQKENETLMLELETALEEAQKLKEQAEAGMDKALEDLELMQKRTQFELIGTIVRVALWVIGGVGILTTLMYAVALMSDVDTQIIGSTWSNMFGILLTNAFSIVGTIMGVKYATDNTKE